MTSQLESICDVAYAPLGRLNPKGVKFCQNMQNTIGNKLIGIAAFRNHDATKQGTPLGIYSVVTPDAPVTAEMIPDSMFESMVIVPIQNSRSEEMDEKKLLSLKSQLVAALPVVHGQVYNINNYDPVANVDTKHWQPAMGLPSASAGFYSKTINGLSGDDFYIVVRAGVPVAVQGLREYVAKNQPMTMDKLYNSREFKRVRQASMRNSQRLAWDIARQSKLAIPYTRDYSAFQDPSYALPYMAEPAYSQYLSDIAPSMTENGAKYVILNQAAPVNESPEKLFVHQGPRNGIAEFNIAEGRFRHGLPCTTRKKDLKRVPTPDQKEIKLQAKYFSWPNQSRAPINEHLLPGAYEIVDDKYREQLDEQGVDDYTSSVIYRPLVVRIAHEG